MQKTRLFYIANVRLPTEKAHGIQIMNMCEAFAKQNIDLTLIVPKKWFMKKLYRDKVKDIFEFYGIEKCFIIKKLPIVDLMILDRYIQPLPFFIFNLTFSLTACFYVLWNNPDLIFTRSLTLAGILSVFWPKKICFEGHDFFNNNFFSKIYCRFLRRLSAIVTTTRAFQKQLTDHKIYPEKILIVPNAVNLAYFHSKNTRVACKKLFGRKKQKIVLYTGSLHIWKGVYTLVEAAKYLDERFSIWIIGGSEKEKNYKNLKQLILKLRLTNVYLKGFMEHYKIRDYLISAAVLVSPNSAKEPISQKFTSPLKIFEYMACKKPIVASDVPSIREIADDNSVLFVEADNPKALADGIKKLFSVKGLAEKLAENSYKNVQNFSWDKRAQKILKHIRLNKIE